MRGFFEYISDKFYDVRVLTFEVILANFLLLVTIVFWVSVIYLAARLAGVL